MRGIMTTPLQFSDEDLERAKTKVGTRLVLQGESTMRRLHVLSATLDQAYKDIRTSWNLNQRLPENFPAYFAQYSVRMHPTMRTQLEDTMGLRPTGLFDTHPSNGDRIRRARQAGEPGLFDFDVPAAVLSSNFEVPSKQVTILHYADDHGIPVEMAKLVPVESNSAAPPDEEPRPAEPPGEPSASPDSVSGLRLRRPGES